MNNLDFLLEDPSEEPSKHPTTLAEFRKFFYNQEQVGFYPIEEVRVKDEHPYNGKTIGWQLVSNGKVLQIGSNLHRAYKLYYNRLYNRMSSRERRK